MLLRFDPVSENAIKNTGWLAGGIRVWVAMGDIGLMFGLLIRVWKALICICIQIHRDYGGLVGLLGW